MLNWMFIEWIFEGLNEQWNFFVSEVDFENVVKVLGFTYVFKNG